MNDIYDREIKLSQTDLSFFYQAVDIMISDMKQILNSNSIDPVEKVYSFVRYQCLELIKLFNLFKNSFIGDNESDFFVEYNFIVGEKIKKIYFELFDECVKNQLFRTGIDRELVFETIQDIIVYFTEIYYETKKIGVSLNYLEDAVKLLVEGLLIPKSELIRER